ncbi:unnamed protein product [Ilex paraguariensis]|uniref:Uncharacterized protein n=1 Tax=Ilex paraguariensis TaxID=185542 RepID=A0ABC8V0W6_9AQUA
MVSIPAKYQGNEGFRRSHPVLLVVAGDETNKLSLDQKRCHLGGCGRDGSMEFQSGYAINSPTARQFYSLSSSFYVQALRFQSAVLMVRCNHRILAPGLEMQVFVKEIDSWIHNSAATQTYDWALLMCSFTRSIVE